MSQLLFSTFLHDQPVEPDEVVSRNCNGGDDALNRSHADDNENNVSYEEEPDGNVDQEIAAQNKDDNPVNEKSFNSENVQPQQKKKSFSKKNRNIKALIQNLKNKVETLQSNNGGTPNFLLIFEDNFSEVSATRKTSLNRKIVVTAEGDLKNKFITNSLGFDPERMLFLKKGRTLENDYSILDEYSRNRALPKRNSNESAVSDKLIDFFKDVARSSFKRGKGRQRKGRKRKAKNRDTSSSDEFSTIDSTSSEEIHLKHKKRKKIELTVQKEPLIDINESVSSYEEDDDEFHGTVQRSKSSGKKRQVNQRYQKERKQKHDKHPPKKVFTPGSQPISTRKDFVDNLPSPPLIHHSTTLGSTVSAIVTPPISNVKKNAPAKDTLVKDVPETIQQKNVVRKPLAPKASVSNIRPLSKPSGSNTNVAKKTVAAGLVDKENLPNVNSLPGPSGQFRNGRAAELLKAANNISKSKAQKVTKAARKLFTLEDIEKELDIESTPTRKKK